MVGPQEFVQHVLAAAGCGCFLALLLDALVIRPLAAREVAREERGRAALMARLRASSAGGGTRP